MMVGYAKHKIIFMGQVNFSGICCNTLAKVGLRDGRGGGGLAKERWIMVGGLVPLVVICRP